MSDDRQPSVLGSLPRTRPHRRSDKRPRTALAPEVSEVSETPKAKAAPAKARSTTPGGNPSPADSHGPLETVVQAAGELAEIGLHAGARALRGALSRLPRP